MCLLKLSVVFVSLHMEETCVHAHFDALQHDEHQRHPAMHLLMYISL